VSSELTCRCQLLELLDENVSCQRLSDKMG
jgi:hypothetical protein